MEVKRGQNTLNMALVRQLDDEEDSCKVIGVIFSLVLRFVSIGCASESSLTRFGNDYSYMIVRVVV